MIATRFALAAVFALSVGVCPGASLAEPDHAGVKSESDALWLSLAGTAVPVLAVAAMTSNNHHSENDGPIAVVGITGYLLGPSAGHFYAGRPGRALLGVGIRSAALGIAVASFHDSSSDIPSAGTGGVLALLVGSASMVIDIGDAPRSARIHNGKRPDARICVAPGLVGPRGAPGLQVTVRF